VKRKNGNLTATHAIIILQSNF